MIAPASVSRVSPFVAAFQPRRALAVALAAFALHAATAGDARAQGFHLRGGLNLATASLDPEPAAPARAKMLKGYNAALLAEMGNGFLSLITGAGYETRGIKTTGAGAAGDGEHRLEYVTVPVMAGFGSPSVNANASLFLNFGVEPAFLLAARHPDASPALTAEGVSDFDFNARVEFGLELPVSYTGPSIIVGAAYTHGFADVARGDITWNNRAFHAFAGLKLRTF